MLFYTGDILLFKDAIKICDGSSIPCLQLDFYTQIEFVITRESLSSHADLHRDEKPIKVLSINHI